LIKFRKMQVILKYNNFFLTLAYFIGIKLLTYFKLILKKYIKQI
jgi:hypothetical protein